MMSNSADEDLLQPFFIVGAVRSGTTLLRLMLGHHPSICDCHEMEYITSYISSNNGLFPQDMDEYREYLKLDKGFNISKFDIPDNLSFEDTANDFFTQLKKRCGRPISGAVVHNDFEFLPKLWKNAKYIFLARDPRDVARSSIHMGWCGNAWGGVPVWSNAYKSWQKLSQQVPESNKLEIRFEDLIFDHESVLKNVCNFLDVEYAPEMVDIDKDTTYSRPNPKESKSWRNNATDYEVRQVESRLGNLLLEAGYEHSGLPVLELNLINKTKLKVDDLCRRVAFRWQRYGFLLWLGCMLGNRIPLGKKLETYIKIKTRDIDIQYHK